MKKQIILFALLVGIFSLVACNKKNAEKTQSSDTTEVNQEVDKEMEEEEITEVPPAKPYIMASIKKTPCYGKCPTYEVKIYNDGRAEYHGKMFVERMGKHTGRIDEATLKSIKGKAMEVNFFDFYNEYPTSDIQVADLPTTVTYFRIGDMEKTVVNKMQAPDELKAYEKFLIDIIDRTEWIKVDE